MGISWGKLAKELRKMAGNKKIPLIGAFELTSRCNLNCKMCYIGRPADDMDTLKQEYSAKEWISLAEEARDAGMLHLLLTGGEVFLRKDFKEIYEEVSRMGFVVEIYTNATMITPEIAKWLGRIPPSRVGVTLYGASSDTYARVCNNPGGFERAVGGVDSLLEEGITLHLKTTVIKENINDFDQLAIFAEERGLLFRVVDYISPGRKESTACPEAERLEPEDLIDYKQYVRDYFKKNRAEKKIAGTKHDDYFAEDTPVDNDRKQKFIDGKDPFFCAAGESSFWITWDGRMTPCGLMDEPGTFPWEKGFALAWKELQDKCSSIPVADECRKCSLKKHCLICPARLKNETGFYDKSAPYLCRAANREKFYNKIDS